MCTTQDIRLILNLFRRREFNHRNDWINWVLRIRHCGVGLSQIILGVFS
jgi:hypothetical protein